VILNKIAEIESFEITFLKNCGLKNAKKKKIYFFKLQARGFFFFFFFLKKCAILKTKLRFSMTNYDFARRLTAFLRIIFLNYTFLNHYFEITNPNKQIFNLIILNQNDSQSWDKQWRTLCQSS